jgi:hypothetical protein
MDAKVYIVDELPWDTFVVKHADHVAAMDAQYERGFDNGARNKAAAVAEAEIRGLMQGEVTGPVTRAFYEQGKRDALTPEVFDKWVNGEVAKAVADERLRIRKAVADLFSDQTWFLLPDKVQRDLLAVIDGGTE